MTTAANILASEKAAAAANQALVTLIETDASLARLIAVWGSVPRTPDPVPDEEYPSALPESMRLRWLWSRVEPDPVPEWITYSGLPDAPHVRRSIMLAISNRIVLPDGTLAPWADAYIQRQARMALGIRGQPAPETPAPTPSRAPVPPPPAPAPTPESLDDTGDIFAEGAIRPGRRLRGAGGRR